MRNLVLSQSAEDLLSLWQGACVSGQMPTTRFIDPVALRNWVGDISVIKLHEGEKRFYVSLHGANVVRHLGPNFHRKYLEDVIPDAALYETILPYDLSIRTLQPTYSIQHASLKNGLFKSLERMIMPLSGNEADKVKQFLVWVAPIRSNSKISSSIFVPFDEAEMLGSGQGEPDAVAELYVLADDYRAEKQVA